jgi:protein Tex
MTPSLDIAGVVAGELGVSRAQVQKTLALFAEGATLPFIARYRKEQTGGLDEVQLAAVRERGTALEELAARKATVLAEIGKQGKLTPELETRIAQTISAKELEDLYLPFKPRRRTRALMAKERGLEPLADEIWAQPQKQHLQAASFLGPEVLDEAAAWQGARDILAERIAENADIRATLRTHATEAGNVETKVIKGKEEEGKKFSDYFDYAEPVSRIPSHRTLAMRRGESEGFLRVKLVVDRDSALALLRQRVLFGKDPRSPYRQQLIQAIDESYDRLLASAVEIDVRIGLKEKADVEAIRVFAENVRHVLMASPLGGKRMIAIDPGLRTGCKVVVLGETGDLRDKALIFPHEARQLDKAAQTIIELASKYQVEAIAVGNGTAGRETHDFVRKLKGAGKLGKEVIVALVSESGASVYSASDIAREELPDEDVTVRGAVSIGRRLQDPLAELVKIDPKSIGVGQYQHDVPQPALARALVDVVESCVNKVGVEVNTASAPLLSQVAGIGPSLARSIILHRAAKGPFKQRQDLLTVPRLGPKAFEQAAGFLRIHDGAHPLDGSGVHPESYAVAEKMAADLGVPLGNLIGRAELLRKIDPKKYVTAEKGEPTIRDILAELEKPGRDPRPPFEETGFRDDITEISHLSEGMVLDGVVTNVTAFGAFVDVGVHQDGLVHVSQIANRFVKDPAEVVKPGDRVKVRVLQVDLARKRIGLSMKTAAAR